jgi:hypothetical protein
MDCKVEGMALIICNVLGIADAAIWGCRKHFLVAAAGRIGGKRPALTRSEPPQFGEVQSTHF